MHDTRPRQGRAPPSNEPERADASSRWAADAEHYDAWFDQPWGCHASRVEHDRATLDVAQRRVSSPLAVADAHDLPFPDATFAITFAVTVCEFVADIELVFSELARVTHPGGRVIVGALNRSSPWGWWNRSQFAEPPWDTARFLTPRELERLGARHGATTLSHALYAPRALPGIDHLRPLIEPMGQSLLPAHGAFTVVTIQR